MVDQSWALRRLSQCCDGQIKQSSDVEVNGDDAGSLVYNSL